MKRLWRLLNAPRLEAWRDEHKARNCKETAARGRCRCKYPDPAALTHRPLTRLSAPPVAKTLIFDGNDWRMA